MALIPKFLREFPENVPSIVEGDLMPISRADGDDSYKITTQKLRDDVLGQPLVGINKPYIYGNSHYTTAVGTMVHAPLHGPNSVVCSSSTDFEAIQPGYLCRLDSPFPMDFITVISKNYTDQYLVMGSDMTPLTTQVGFQYSNSRFALVSTTDDAWRPVSGENTLMGLVHEHTYFDYEPAKSTHVLVSDRSTNLVLPRNTWTLISMDNVEWNNFGEWNQTSSCFKPYYEGLYHFEISFTLALSDFTPGDYYILVLAVKDYLATPLLFYTQTYPSIVPVLGVSVNFSSMLALDQHVEYSWYIQSTAEFSSISTFPASMSVKRERSKIGRTYDRS